jgi:UDP-glucuronate 4-epimerase
LIDVYDPGGVKPMTVPPTYAVTGAAGFIGSHLAAALLDRGAAVVGIDSFSDYYARERKERNLSALRQRAGFRLVEGDLVDLPLDELLAGVAGVFHLAAQPGVRGSWGRTFAVYVQDNLVATQRVFEAAAAAGVRVAFASSSSVYGNAAAHPTREDATPRPVSPYGVTKLCCEDLARAYAVEAGLDFVALRYFTVYGPRQRPDMATQRIATALAAGGRFQVYGDGAQSRDVTYVSDAVDATTAAMERAPSGAIYNVGGGSETSLREIIRLCERLSGRALAIETAPAAAGDVRRTSADTSRIRAEVGWAPRVSLEDGLARQLVEAGALRGGPRGAIAAR